MTTEEIKLTEEQLLLEASKVEQQFKTAITKIGMALVEDGYLRHEVDFVVTFYTQLKELGILESRHFKLNQKGQKINIKDFGTMSKYPQYFFDAVMALANSDTFLLEYNIEVNEDGYISVKQRGVDVDSIAKTLYRRAKANSENQVMSSDIYKYIDRTDSHAFQGIVSNLYTLDIEVVDSITYKVIKPMKSKYSASFSKLRNTGVDHLIVGEDTNYITFIFPDRQSATKIRNFYKEVFYKGEQKLSPKYGLNNSLINRSGNGLFPSWCILSSSGHFNSQKKKKGNIWAITFRKENPLDLYYDYLKSKAMTDEDIKLRLEQMETSTSMLESEFREMYLGECVDVDIDLIEGHGSGSNHYTAFSNSDCGYESYLKMSTKLPNRPDLSYRYEDLDYKDIGSKLFETAGSTLIEVNTNLFDTGHSNTLKIPYGITKIQAGAISNSKMIKQITLSQTVTVIESGAINDCPNLIAVVATNNLRLVGKRAFMRANEALPVEKLPYIGIPRQEGNKVIFKKPKNLIYSPTLKKFQKAAKTENKGEPAIDFGLNFIETPFYEIEGNSIFFKPASEIEDSRVPKVVIPEGVERVNPLSPPLHINTEALIFPKSFKYYKAPLLTTGSEVDLINMYKCYITSILSNTFVYGDIKTVVLPAILNVIQANSFSMSLEKIVIPSSVKWIDKQAFNNVLLASIQTDSIQKFKAMLEKQLEHFKEANRYVSAYERLNKVIINHMGLEEG